MEALIGRTIRQARRRLGLTQEELAERAEVSVRWLSKVENCRGGAPRMDYVGKIARAVGLDVADLVRGDVGSLGGAVANHRRDPSARRRGAVVGASTEPRSTRWGTVIGRVWFPWVVASFGPYRAENVACYFDPEEPSYPPEVDAALVDLPPDSGAYRLARFHVSSRRGELEEPALVLHFQPTTHNRALVTDERLDVPLTAGGRTFTLRERYAAGVDLRSGPVSELATRWGIGLSIVTADGRLLVGERDGTCSPAAAGSLVPALDAGEDGAPDHFAAAHRVVHENMGLDIRPSELTWLSLGVNSCLCEYNLIGRVDTPNTLAEGEDHARRHADVGSLRDVGFNPTAVARFCSDPDRRFSPIALISVVHTLLHEYGVSRTEAAFQDVSVEMTQHLPHWLAPEPD